jgi:oligopeptide/dipeptide ABC transporter ATP-binding protein
MSVFRVEDLAVSFGPAGRRARVVDGVSFSVDRGETLGLVGESGCGKSVTLLSSVRLQPSPPSHVERGSAWLGDTDLMKLDAKALRALWGSRIGVVFQDPMTSLNPVFTIGQQLRETLAVHTRLSAAEREERVIAMLDRVGINAPQRRLRQYPHELSGGLRQRVLIAMALLLHPELLLADEPTTALDVTLQAQILALLRELRDELGMGIVFVTHDLGVVAQFCDRVAVMYAGRIVESARVADLFRAPRHPYTGALLASTPTLDSPKDQPLATIEGMVPAPAQRGPGCTFAPRCARAGERCRAEAPALIPDGDRAVACFHPLS